MSYPLQSQINLWWQAVSSAETLSTYQKTVQVTWNILRETTKLLWLFLCLGLVLFDWLWDKSTRSGQQAKAWWEGIQEPKAERIWSEVSSFFSSASRTSVTTLLGQAREQLGLPTSAVTPLPSPTIDPKPQPTARKAEGVSAVEDGTDAA